MKTEKEIDVDILLIMARIQNEFPELLKYLPEMPIKNIEINTNALGISMVSLIEYHHSLINLVDKYAMEKPATLKNR